MSSGCDVPSETQMAKCFGKKNSCGKNCPLKTVCLDKYKEEQEEKHRQQYRETHFIDNMDADGEHVSADFPDASNDGIAGYTDEELRQAINVLDVSDKCRQELCKLIDSQSEHESVEDATKELLRRLGEIYVNDPTGFDVMFFQILAGGNQAAIARQRGCTKQNINKIMAKGKIRLAAYREHVQLQPGCRLTFRELAVYHALEIDNMTYRQAADMIGCSFRTIGNIAQKMRSKGVKLHKKNVGRRKSSKKSNKGCKVDGR